MTYSSGTLMKPKMKKPVVITLTLVFGILITIFVATLLFNVTDYGITIASFGATVFTILSRDVKKRKIFGAYFVATLIGYVFSQVPKIDNISVAVAAISSVIAMTLLEFQHAPAIGISIAMVLNKFTFWTDIIVLMSIFLILGVTLMLRISLVEPERIFSFVEIEEEKIKWNLKKKRRPEYVKL